MVQACLSAPPPPIPLSAGLRSLDLSYNHFPYLPHALSSARQLTRLSVMADAVIRLTFMDADLLELLPTVKPLTWCAL